MGFQVQANGDITYREWAPNALRAYVIGDFSTLRSAAVVWNSLISHDLRWLEQRRVTNDKRRLWRLGDQVLSKRRAACYTPQFEDQSLPPSL